MVHVMPADNRMAEAKNVGRDGTAFLLVGIEEFVGGTAVCDQGQFPGQVMGVHDSGVHALATCRKVNLHGVPSQQDPPSPVCRRSPELRAKQTSHPGAETTIHHGTRWSTRSWISSREGGWPARSPAAIS
jgi:hypothetical protein